MTGAHLVDLVIGHGMVHVTFDDTRMLDVALDGLVDIETLGFTAATGATSTRHAVDDVVIERCPN